MSPTPSFNSVKNSSFAQLLTGPVQKVVKDLHNIFSTQTDVFDSAMRATITTAAFGFGVGFSHTMSPNYAQGIREIWRSLGAPEFLLPLLVPYTGGLITGYVGNEFITQTLRVYNYCKYGDMDYFLTESEINKIAVKIKKSENRDGDIEIIKQELTDVLVFCVEKIRSEDVDIRDMQKIYIRIFKQLRLGDLSSYYKHKSLMLTHREQMENDAKRFRDEMNKVQDRIDAINRGDMEVGLDSEPESDEELDEDLVPSSSTMESRIMAEIHSLEQRLNRAKEDTEDVFLPEISKMGFAMQKSISLQEELKHEERYLYLLQKQEIVLAEKFFKISLTKFVNEKMSGLLARKIDEKNVSEDNKEYMESTKESITLKISKIEVEYRRLQEQLSVIRREIHERDDSLVAKQKEYSAVGVEIKQLRDEKITSANAEILELEGKIKQLSAEFGMAKIDSNLLSRLHRQDSETIKRLKASRKSSSDVPQGDVDEDLDDNVDRMSEMALARASEPLKSIELVMASSGGSESSIKKLTDNLEAYHKQIDKYHAECLEIEGNIGKFKLRLHKLCNEIINLNMNEFVSEHDVDEVSSEHSSANYDLFDTEDNRSRSLPRPHSCSHSPRLDKHQNLGLSLVPYSNRRNTLEEDDSMHRSGSSRKQSALHPGTPLSTPMYDRQMQTYRKTRKRVVTAENREEAIHDLEQQKRDARMRVGYSSLAATKYI